MGGMISTAAKKPKPKDEALRDEVSEIVRENLTTPTRFDEALGAVAAREKTTMVHLVVEHGSGHINVTDAIDMAFTAEAKRKSEDNRYICFFQRPKSEEAPKLTPLELAVAITKDKSKAEGSNLFIGEAALHLARRLNQIPVDDAHHESAVGQIRSAAKALKDVDNFAANEIKALARPAPTVAVTGVGTLAARGVALGATA